jgi:hypothetical protein
MRCLFCEHHENIHTELPENGTHCAGHLCMCPFTRSEVLEDRTKARTSDA